MLSCASQTLRLGLSLSWLEASSNTPILVIMRRKQLRDMLQKLRKIYL